MQVPPQVFLSLVFSQLPVPKHSHTAAARKSSQFPITASIWQIYITAISCSHWVPGKYLLSCFDVIMEILEERIAADRRECIILPLVSFYRVQGCSIKCHWIKAVVFYMDIALPCMYLGDILKPCLDVVFTHDRYKVFVSDLDYLSHHPIPLPALTSTGPCTVGGKQDLTELA